jgi:hypothetical protein
VYFVGIEPSHWAGGVQGTHTLCLSLLYSIQKLQRLGEISESGAVCGAMGILVPFGL